MTDRQKTKKQLIAELQDLRRRIRRWDAFEIKPRHRNPALGEADRESETILDSLMEHVVYHDLDITERKSAEEALRKSEDRYRALVETIPHGIQEIDCFGTITFVNSAHNKIYGYSDTEMVGKSVLDLQISDASRKHLADYLAALLKEQPEPSPYTSKNVTADGRIIDVQIDWNYKRDDQGAVTGFISVVTDVTKLKQAADGLQNDRDELEQRVSERTAELLTSNEQLKREIEKRKMIEKDLQESQEKYRSIVESAPFGYYRLGKDGRYQYVNPEWENLHGLSGGEIIGKTIDATETDESRSRVPEYFCRALDGQTIKGESKRILKNGAQVYHEFTIQPVYQNGEIAAIEGFINDRTEQKRSEDMVRNLSHLLMQVQERERQMISYELHDRIAQNLSMLKIDCAMLFEKQPVISRELENKIKNMSKLIELIITSVRDLAYNLRPPGLGEMSIVRAVEIYCEEFSESSGLEIDFRSTGMHALEFDYDTKLHLYRLVQEGLNNIRKHADADRATVKIIGASPNIILRIEDNGKGFDPIERELSLDSRKRMGLRSMQERVNLLGGQMTIRSRPMAGAKIFIKFPFKEYESDSEAARVDH